MKTITIPVPDWANWWTVDRGGDLAIREWEPTKGLDIWVHSGGRYIYLYTVNRPADWTKELHRIE